MDIEHAIIKSNPFFSSFDDKDYSTLLPHITLVTLKPQEVLFHEGDFSDAFYIVKDGAIRIITINSRGETVFVARVGARGFFGEQAFSPAFSPRRRATAIAQVESTLYRFPRDVLRSLRHRDPRLQLILQKQGVQYIREKLQTLVNNFQQTAFHIEQIMGKIQSFPKRSVLFFQGETAHRAYIVVDGEIELRTYDQEKRIQQQTSIGPGQLFGAEGLSEHGIYLETAITKEDASIISIDSSRYQKVAENHPLLKKLGERFSRQFTFKAKGKILQFRSEYLDMPAITSIISLSDGQEIVCQQIISADMFIASITHVTATHEIKFTRDENYSRTLSLEKNKIIGFSDYGIWQDSHALLDFIIEGVEITEKQIEEFLKTGRILTQTIEKTDEKLVCICMRVPYSIINKLIVSENADFSDIRKRTGAGSVCGGCKPLILEMLGTNAWSPCIVFRVINHTPHIRSFQFRPLNKTIFPFQAGQYLVIKVKIDNVWVQRNYTLTSTSEQPYYEITVKKEPKGLFSSWLFEHAEENLIVYVAGPYGQFTLESTNGMPIVCFMGGIGITPAIAFTRYLANAKKQQRIYIDYSVVLAEQFILMDEFSNMTKKHSTIAMNHRITNISGMLTEQEIKTIILSIDSCHIYLCGPQGLEKLVIDTFNKMNLTSERLHVEQFIHAGSPENLPQTIK